MKPLASECGFSLIEALVAVFILSIGMLGIAMAFLQGTMMLTGSELDVLAREKAAETIESVFTARDTRIIQWSQIRNVNGENADGGIFLDGPRPLVQPGSDGLVNTADDTSDLETLVQPGADGLLGTADDVRRPLADFTREIVIRNVSSTLRELRVVITYKVGTAERRYEIKTLISSYA